MKYHHQRSQHFFSSFNTIVDIVIIQTSNRWGFELMKLILSKGFLFTINKSHKIMIFSTSRLSKLNGFPKTDNIFFLLYLHGTALPTAIM